MKIYNTMTRQKEEFVPNDPKEVKIYACGCPIKVCLWLAEILILIRSCATCCLSCHCNCQIGRASCRERV